MLQSDDRNQGADLKFKLTIIYHENHRFNRYQMWLTVLNFLAVNLPNLGVSHHLEVIGTEAGATGATYIQKGPAHSNLSSPTFTGTIITPWCSEAVFTETLPNVSTLLGIKPQPPMWKVGMMHWRQTPNFLNLVVCVYMFVNF